jgi:hypothetical protein
VLPAVELGSQPVLAGGLLDGWLDRRSTSRLDVREQLRQLG